MHGAPRPKAAKERSPGRWCAERPRAPGYGDFANAEGVCGGMRLVASDDMTGGQ